MCNNRRRARTRTVTVGAASWQGAAPVATGLLQRSWFGVLEIERYNQFNGPRMSSLFSKGLNARNALREITNWKSAHEASLLCRMHTDQCRRFIYLCGKILLYLLASLCVMKCQRGSSGAALSLGAQNHDVARCKEALITFTNPYIIVSLVCVV